MTALQVKTTVLPDHRIELHVPELPAGRTATVFIVLDDETPPKRPLQDVLGNYPGGQLFKTAQEVEEYLRAERDSWGK